MKIVHLATTHRAGDPRIFLKECRTLSRAGHEVSFIVPHTRDETREGVQILGVPVPANGKERLTRTVYHVFRRALSMPADAVFHAHDSDLLPVMFALKLLRRRVVYDMHENTPQQMLYQHWIPEAFRPPIGSLAGGVERVGSWMFDGLLAAEPSVAERLAPRHVEVVRNFPLLEEFPADVPPYHDRANLVVYIGSITRVRGIDEMLSAMDRLPSDLDARLVAGGPFHPASLEDEVQSHPAAARTEFPGYLARIDVAERLHHARVGLAVLHPTQKYLNSYPTKLFEYMASSIPVIVSDFPLWRPFVEESECGLVIDPMDAGALADAIEWILRHPDEAEAMGRRGRKAVEQRWNWERESDKLLSFYEGLESAR